MYLRMHLCACHMGMGYSLVVPRASSRGNISYITHHIARLPTQYDVIQNSSDGRHIVQVNGRPLAAKPDLTSLLRCRWAPTLQLHAQFVLKAASDVAVGAQRHCSQHPVVHSRPLLDAQTHLITAHQTLSVSTVDFMSCKRRPHLQSSTGCASATVTCMRTMCWWTTMAARCC